MELIITPVFWLLLWQYRHDMEEFKLFWFRLQLVIDHSLPLVVLMIDYVFLNALSFIPRHFVFVSAASIAYMLLNMAATLHLGQPLYPFIDWKGVTGFCLVPLGMMFGCWLLFRLLELITYKKLKALGYTDIINVI